jgi:putative transposase
VDVGVVNLVALSTGELVRGPRCGEATTTRLTLAQQKLARQHRGSARRARQVEVVASLHRKTVNQRMNAAHQLSRRLVNEFDLLVLEKLSVTSMARSPRAVVDPATPGQFLPNGAARKAALNRSIHDAGWATLSALLTYKAESAGRDVVRVSARYTSQTCAECGNVEAGNRVSQAVFRCCSCGHEAHADTNAARNILRAGRAQRASARAG